MDYDQSVHKIKGGGTGKLQAIKVEFRQPK